MARTRVRYTEAPARNDVYVGMLAVTVLMLVIGCVLLALECNEYEWTDTPPVSPAVVLPTLPKPTQPPPSDLKPKDPPVTPPKDMEASRPTPPSNLEPVVPATPPTATASRSSLPTIADPVGPPALLPQTSPDPNRLPQPGFNPSLPRR